MRPRRDRQSTPCRRAGLRPRVAMFEMAVPCEVWGIDRTSMGVPASEVRVCSPEAAPLRTEPRVSRSAPEHGLEALGGPTRSSCRPPPKPLDRAATALARCSTRSAPAHAQRGTRVAVAVLGGLRARRGRAARRSPGHDALDVRRPVPRPASRTSTWTRPCSTSATTASSRSAGTAAAIDLCLHLVRLDHGAEVANTIARRMVVPPHRDGGQAQYVEAPGAQVVAEDPIGHGDGVGRRPPRPRAQRRGPGAAGVHGARARSPAASAPATGSTPLQWLLQQRVALAQRLLETTDLPVDLVAHRAGFGSAPNLRQHFGRLVGTSPPPIAGASAGPGERPARAAPPTGLGRICPAWRHANAPDPMRGANDRAVRPRWLGRLGGPERGRSSAG